MRTWFVTVLVFEESEFNYKSGSTSGTSFIVVETTKANHAYFHRISFFGDMQPSVMLTEKFCSSYTYYINFTGGNSVASY